MLNITSINIISININITNMRKSSFWGVDSPKKVHIYIDLDFKLENGINIISINIISIEGSKIKNNEMEHTHPTTWILRAVVNYKPGNSKGAA